MKTPSSLLLLSLLSVALASSAADLPSGQRCDAAWLTSTDELMKTPGHNVSGERVEAIPIPGNGGGEVITLKFGNTKTCDAATWRSLATLEPIAGEVVFRPGTHDPVGGTALRWRNRAAGDLWGQTAIVQQIGLMLVVNDFYASVDAKAAAIITAGDAVIDAAKSLGLADFTVSPKSLAELGPGTSGGPIGALKPRIVTILAEGKQAPATVAPDQLGPTMRKLVTDGPTLGSAVVDFRVAVLALEAELGRLGGSDANLKKHVSGATEGLKDFTSGLPKEFVLVAADKADALAEDKYGAALGELVGSGDKLSDLGSQGLRGAALLDPVDLGLRNLIAVRSAEVDAIVAAAKKRLNGLTVAQYETSARSADAVKDLPANSLSRAVFDTLSKTPEYAKLDQLYENNKRDQGDAWVKSPAGMAMASAREDLKTAALSAQVETDANGHKAVVFTQGGQKRTLGSLVPSSVENDPAARSDAAEIISRLIVDGAQNDAKYQAVLAAFGGAGQPGQPLDTNLKPGEVPVSKDVPPATQKIKAGAAGCDTPKDLVRNDYETYAARQRAAAADMAGANVRSRNDVEKERLRAQTASAAACQKKKDDAKAIKQDYFDDPAIAQAARTKATTEAETWCAADTKAIDEAAANKIKDLALHEAGDRDPAKLRTQADADLAAGFAVAVSASAESLRRDYTTAGNSRLKKLAEATGNSSRLTAFTALWFAQEWPQDASKKTVLEAAVADCSAKLGLGDKSNSPSYHNPDSADNVDKYCKVNEKLTAFINASKGSNHPVP